ncbi:hypothetical protein, partial [Stenotrophomonas maltophilia]|uniref:hypothetical protein n=1 Tax=Stenotrophomonas maltophilia TaxID=40324 RepID=UPI001952C2C6
MVLIPLPFLTGNLVATNRVQHARSASSSALPSGDSSPPGLDGRLLDQIHEPIVRINGPLVG